MTKKTNGMYLKNATNPILASIIMPVGILQGVVHNYRKWILI